MMIVAGTIEVDPSQRDEFLAARRDSIAKTMTEPGCIEYSFGGDCINPGIVRVFERWESREALQTHLGELAKAGNSGATIPVKNLAITQYDIASEGPLGS